MVHVTEVGLAGAEDSVVATVARSEDRTLVTENIADFANEVDLVLVCVLERRLPSGAGQTGSLAALLDRWAEDHPRPYRGQHWPS